MNQSFDISNTHLPKITQNESTYLRGTSKQSLDMKRSASYNQTSNNEKANLTKKLIVMQDIRDVEEYEKMNDKDLLREHEKLLKILKKFQEIIDVNLQRKQKERAKIGKKPQTSKQQIFEGQVANNKKIIDNYSNELRQYQAIKKCRKLHEILDEKSKVQVDISQLKKEIFSLKNEDNMAGRSLIADRGVIEKELKQHEKDLKLEVIKKQDYQQKLITLNTHLADLKKECEGLNINEATNQKSSNATVSSKMVIKKKELQQVTKSYVNYEEGIQDNMVAKAKRNKNILKEIEGSQRRVVQLNHKIQKYKDKIAKYQQAMQISPSKPRE